MNMLQTERDLYINLFRDIVNQTADYIKTNGLKSMILGLSGGIDSTLVAMVCRSVACKLKNDGYDVSFYGYSLPSSTNSNEEIEIADQIGLLCDEYNVIDISDAVGAFNDVLGESGPLQKGNIKARIRMMILYHFASLNKGIVMDTDNLTEHYLGFWTIHGDVGDFCPLASLWKTEVYKMANVVLDDYKHQIGRKNPQWKKFYLPEVADAIQKSINITPTDGNGVKVGGDMAQIAPGYTYDDVDKILQVYMGESKEDLQYPDEVVQGVIMRHKNSNYKREPSPIRVKIDKKKS